MQEAIKFSEAGEFKAIIYGQEGFVEVAGDTGNGFLAIWGTGKIDAEYFHGFISQVGIGTFDYSWAMTFLLIARKVAKTP